MVAWGNDHIFLPIDVHRDLLWLLIPPFLSILKILVESISCPIGTGGRRVSRGGAEYAEIRKIVTTDHTEHTKMKIETLGKI